MSLLPRFLFFGTILLLRTTLAYYENCENLLDSADAAALQDSLQGLGVEGVESTNATYACCWDIAECDDTSGTVRLTTLGLINYSLRSTLPASIGNLTALEELTLSSSILTGSIPDSWGNLKNLTYLDIRNNSLKGTVDVVGKMTKLEYIFLDSNQFSGGVNEISFSNLTNLRFLSMGDNDFTGYFPEWIGNLSNLEYLSLSENIKMSPSNLPSASASWPDSLQTVVLSSMNLIGSVPEALVSLPNLSYINLSHNSLSGSLPNAFFFRTLGSEVYLNSNSFTGVITLNLANENISFLDLSNNFLSGNVVDYLKILCADDSNSTIKYLNVSQNNLTGKIFPSFSGGNCVSLATLDLGYNNLSGNIPKFSGLTGLTYLYLENNKFSGKLPTLNNGKITTFNVANNNLTGNISAVTGLRNISILNLSGNHFSGILPARTIWPMIEKIDLSRNLFYGKIPISLGNAADYLQDLDFSENNFTGEIPFTLFHSSNLRSLNLRGNRLNKLPHNVVSLSDLKIINFGNNAIDKIPEWITGYTRLEEVYFDNNNITGAIPSFLGNFSYLQVLDLSNNPFDSGVPDTFGTEEFVYDDSVQMYRTSSFSSLSYLNLSRCNLSGTIPTKIGNLQRLSIIDLSDNQLNGEIPGVLGGISLKHLNLSNNHLSGRVPDLFFKNNLTNCSTYSFLPNNLHAKCKGGFIVNDPLPRLPVYAIAIIVVGSILLIVVATFAAYLWICKKKEDFITENINKHTVKFLPLPVICEATDNFSESNELGVGGFGIVYKGKTKTGELWAVKRAKKASAESLEQFKNEVETISRMNHKNIVKLIGFFHGDNEQIMVYEFIENGTLKSALTQKEGTIQPVLTFEQRIDIALGAAEGLRYLHTQAKPTIIHRDVKSENILLDAKWEAKVADFGLLKDNEDQEELAKRTAVSGTYGYMDPEYYTTYRVTTKIDVYSFGVVILELITGKPAIIDEETNAGDRERISLANWALKMMQSTLGLSAIVDPSLESNYSLDDMNVLASIAASCLQKKSMYRPEMADVASYLRLLQTKLKNKDVQVMGNNGLTVRPIDEGGEEEGPVYPIIGQSTSLNSGFSSSFFRSVPKDSVLLPR